MIQAEKIEVDINNRILAGLKIIEVSDQNVGLSQKQLDKLFPVLEFEALHVYDALTLKVDHESSSAYSIPFPVLQHRLKEALNGTVLTLYDDRRPEEEHLVVFVHRERGGACHCPHILGGNCEDYHYMKYTN